MLGGISTSILYSAFESWLISSANNLSLSQSDLSSIFGRATLLNGFVATGAGVFSNQLVASSNMFASPFVASGILLLLSYGVIQASWDENYGSLDTSPASSANVFQLKRLGQALRILSNGTYTNPHDSISPAKRVSKKTHI